MLSAVDGPQTHHGLGASGSNANNSGGGSGNSGSQYALCALGVGLIALGIVMIVWSVVPANPSLNNSDSGGKKNQVSSVAFILVGCGVTMLLLSMCLGMRNKQRELLSLQEPQNNQRGATAEQEQRDIAEEQARRYAVPSYEEAVGSGPYPVPQGSLRPSTSQLPSYEDLVQVDRVQYEFEGSEVTPAAPRPASTSAASASAHRPGKNSRKLLALNIRRIKSEKLRLQNVENSQPADDGGIEPLTPPPKYEDKLPAP